LHRAEPALEAALGADLVAVHPLVVEEMATGSISRRGEVLAMLGRLRTCPVLTHTEALGFIDREKLWGMGLSLVDVHVLGSARLSGDELWTRDKRLASTAGGVGVALRPEHQVDSAPSDAPSHTTGPAPTATT
jgi:predicted nucleic acid-binding protein